MCRQEYVSTVVAEFCSRLTATYDRMLNIANLVPKVLKLLHQETSICPGNVTNESGVSTKQLDLELKKRLAIQAIEPEAEWVDPKTKEHTLKFTNQVRELTIIKKRVGKALDDLLTLGRQGKPQKAQRSTNDPPPAPPPATRKRGKAPVDEGLAPPKKRRTRGRPGKLATKKSDDQFPSDMIDPESAIDLPHLGHCTSPRLQEKKRRASSATSTPGAGRASSIADSISPMDLAGVLAEATTDEDLAGEGGDGTAED